MQILVDPGSYGCWNVGDLAMADVATTRIRERFQDAVIYGFTSDVGVFRQVFPHIHPVEADLRGRALSPGRIEGAIRRRLPGILAGLAKPLEYLRDQAPLREIVRKSDFVAVLGMGGINDIFADHALTILKLLEIAQREGKRTVLFGQGLGPIAGAKLGEAARKVLPAVDLIGVREPLYSTRVAEAHGADPERIYVTGDDALELANSHTPSRLGNALGVNVRMASYSGIREDYVEVFRHLLEELRRELRTELIPVPISFHSGESDLVACEQLGVKAESAIPCSPSKVIEQAGKCRLVITGAYHAGVFALGQGVPVIGISNSEYYDQKFLGLAATFPGHCDVVSVKDPDFVGTLRRTVLRRWESAPMCREGILNQAKLLIGKSEGFYGTVFDLMDKRMDAGAAVEKEKQSERMAVNLISPNEIIIRGEDEGGING